MFQRVYASFHFHIANFKMMAHIVRPDLEVPVQLERLIIEPLRGDDMSEFGSPGLCLYLLMNYLSRLVREERMKGVNNY